MSTGSVGDDGFSPGGESVASAGHAMGMALVNVNINSVKPDGDNGGASAAASPADLGGVASKKRKAATGSRGVANLTPEQLAKKRANDREAQRAIRERTKNQIENLERQLHELRNMDHMLELQKAQQAKEFVERENADIKRRLMTIMGMLEPLVHAQMEPQPCIPPTPQAYTPSVALQSGALSYNSPSTTNSAASPAASLEQQQHIPPHQQQPPQAWQVNRNIAPIRPPPPPPSVLSIQQQQQQQVLATYDDYTRSQLEQQRYNLQHTFEMGQERLDLKYVLSSDRPGRPTLRPPSIQRGVHGAQDSPDFLHVPMKHDWTQIGSEPAPPPRPNSWEAPSRFELTGTPMPAPPMPPTAQVPPHHGHASAASSPGYLRHDASSPGAVRSGFGPGGLGMNGVPYLSTPTPGPPPRYTIPTNNCAPTCPLDSLLLDFINERKQRREEGHDESKIAGPQYPSVSSLLNPENSRYSHPLSKFFTDIIGKFPDIANLPERVAVLYIMFIFMRWQVSLTAETYEQLPDWMLPVPSQLTKPHPIWIDYLPFPIMREKLVQLYNPEEYPFDNFFVPYTKTLVLSWPYEDTDTLLQDPESSELMINPVFYRHLRNLDNWRLLGTDFEKTFPKLVGSYPNGQFVPLRRPPPPYR